MRRLGDWLSIRFDLLRCKLLGTHAPVLGYGGGELFVRCRSCGLRTDGMPVAHVRRTRIEVF
jgi:hypothetical protein